MHGPKRVAATANVAQGTPSLRSWLTTPVPTLLKHGALSAWHSATLSLSERGLHRCPHVDCVQASGVAAPLPPRQPSILPFMGLVLCRNAPDAGSSSGRGTTTTTATTTTARSSSSSSRSRGSGNAASSSQQAASDRRDWGAFSDCSTVALLSAFAQGPGVSSPVQGELEDTLGPAAPAQVGRPGGSRRLQGRRPAAAGGAAPSGGSLGMRPWAPAAAVAAEGTGAGGGAPLGSGSWAPAAGATAQVSREGSGGSTWEDAEGEEEGEEGEESDDGWFGLGGWGGEEAGPSDSGRRRKLQLQGSSQHGREGQQEQQQQPSSEGGTDSTSFVPGCAPLFNIGTAGGDGLRRRRIHAVRRGGTATGYGGGVRQDGGGPGADFSGVAGWEGPGAGAAAVGGSLAEGCESGTT